ncbi:xanthine dehydrogenase family protein molybdopterin-binding subunit [Maribellus maritimus]|uniref:xanthine dehydrogenase family protein molybdopterin-binding subunit n=1 Tax=Maribellus maritimus TaxID=2870838 RepID=UPI001EEC9CB8|nr:molybdopterin cofactor-binding domain-containing protein [Maribellus maritimus]MCG6186254.1 molybdopterin-dependent oxidoreductase [Maribellus maritimus]
MDELKDFKEYLKTHVPDVKRRAFLKWMGGGLYVFFNPGVAFNALGGEGEQRQSVPDDFNAFLRIHEDGTVTCFVGKIDMGQGAITSFPQMVADELDVEYDKVKMVLGDTDLCPWDMGTFGSMSVRILGPSVRAAAAEARGVLLQMAAEKLGVEPEELSVESGVIFNKNNKKQKVTYPELTKGQKIARYMDKKPEVKEYSELRVMGTPKLHQDAVDKVTGKALYSGDIRKPEMVYARIVRPPSHAAKLVSADTSDAEKIEGVEIVKDGDLVAVLHKNPEIADKARKLIKAEFEIEKEKDINNANVFEYLLANAPEGNSNIDKGDLQEGRKQSTSVFENEYHDGYVAHSPMEAHTAMAYMEGDKMIVRAGTQTPFPAKSNIARVLGVEEEKVRVQPPFLGGGFGGKSSHQQAIEAARLAKITKKPVMVDWNRKEEFFYDEFRPAAIIKVNSGIDGNGKITFWDYHVYYAGDRGAETMYNVPHQKRTVYGRGWRAPGIHPFPTGAWRGPGNSTNTFGREVQVDIMAAKASIDPVEFRLKNLTDKRAIDVLEEVAKMADWKPTKSPSGRGFGVSIGFDAGTYVAHIVQIDVNKETGEIKVNKVWCAQEMGFCVNPQGATIQMEGCINMGLGYALKETVEFEGGKVKTNNFDSYEIPRFSWIPEIQTKILDRHEPPQGGGEPAIVCMGAVIANAVYDATGARLYEMAMTPERVLEALKKV